MLGILLIDHGSRRAEANASLADMAARLRAKAPRLLCAHAHMELAEPSIRAGFAELAQRGATEVRAVPYFLAPGRHASEDIPRLVREAAEVFPQVAWRVCECLGPHDLLADLALLRAGWNP